MATFIRFLSCCVYILFIFVLYGVNADEFCVLSSPSYVKFSPTETKLKGSQIAQLCGLLLGFSTYQNFDWGGLKATNPFHRPEGLVILDIPKLEVWPELTRCYKMDNDFLAIDLSHLINQVEETFPHSVIIDADSKEKLMSIKSEYPLLSTTEPLSGSILNDTEDELHIMESIADILANKKTEIRDGLPDILRFHLTEIQDLIKIYGISSDQVKKAKSLLKTSINKVQKILLDLYDGDVIFLLISLQENEEFLSRKTRSLLYTSQNLTWNDAPYYSKEYAVVFNILLWSMIMLFISILSIAVFIWHMDPGRDSIIYRMTSQRMKKD